MPPEPGWPGLFFRLDELNDHQDVEGNPIVYRAFARHADSRCVYLGQYTFTKLEGISGREWRELPEKTREIWLKFFGDTLLANRTLARIVLRKSQKEEPTEAQVIAKCESIKAPGARRALAEKMEAEIRRAFNRGEEGIVVWGMKCVSYDYEFESDLSTKWQERHKSTSQVELKARWGLNMPASGSELSDDEVEEDEVLTSRSRGHLSRKAKGKKPTISRGDSVSATKL
ncbi:hypothetical protein BJ322DRAFT_551667 [Thelephora terrestris]|uniref:DUF6697 domain-containing protein n=1 Tax=Thelephora terrestris TaxID=56493 RepID=A0A9P6LAD4_9AGAM|nr:hypothetical protein BJ322DRAFT_551667 [Thelephora terrestris]